MICPKCKQENPEGRQFCSRCHNPLKFVCPTCKNVQDHGGKCDKCGLDFMKYASMMVAQAAVSAEGTRQQVRQRNSIIKQIILLPITGGLSLIKGLRSFFENR